MSNQIFGFYFSGDADKSANDYAIYCDLIQDDCAKMAIRYKNAERNSIYEIELDAADLETFGTQCINLAKLMSGEK